MEPGIDLQEDELDRQLRLRQTILEHTFRALAVLCLVAMVVMTTTEVVMRSFFASSLLITDEVGGYLLVALAFLGLSVGQSRRSFFGVALLQHNLSLRWRVVSAIIFDAVGLFTSLLLAWFCGRMVLQSWHSGNTAATAMATPLWLPQSIIPIGLLALAVVLCRCIRTDIIVLRQIAERN